MNTHLRTGAVAATAVFLVGLMAGQAAAQARFPRPVVRIGLDYTLAEGAEVREIRLISGSATIAGRVVRDVFVWLGDVRLDSTAVIDGSLVVIGGSVTIAEGADIEHDLVVVGGTLEAPAGFAPGHQQVLVGFPDIGLGLRGLVPWVTNGLLLGRPIVPDLPWVWTIVGILFLVSLGLNLLFDGPVRAAAETVATRPLSALLTGLVVLVLTGPLLVIVTATIVGALVLPFVICALLAAWTIGKVGVARGIGLRLWRQTEAESRLQGVRSLVLGFGAITLAYMVPVLGFITWSLVGVFGLGAATVAMLGALRREYPPRERKRPPPPPAPEPPEPGTESAMPAAEAAIHPDEPLLGDPPFDASPPASAALPPTGLLAYPRAAFLDRTAAVALDCVLVAIATALLDLVRSEGVFVLFLFGYHIAFWAWQGTTLGGVIVGLRVVRTDGTSMRFVDALVRALSSLFSVAALGIGFLWMIQDPERQTWHDKIAGTYVVKVPRNTPLR